MRERNIQNVIRYIAGLAASLLLIGIDQLTKVAAVNHLKNKEAIPIIEGVFELQYLENRGAAFGILQNQKILFVVLTILVMVGLIYIYCFRIPQEKRYRLLRFIAVLYAAGALGNFIDRVVRNYVVDFFYFSLIDFPIFNMADIYVVVASGMLLFFGLFYYTESDFERILGKRKKGD